MAKSQTFEIEVVKDHTPQDENGYQGIIAVLESRLSTADGREIPVVWIALDGSYAVPKSGEKRKDGTMRTADDGPGIRGRFRGLSLQLTGLAKRLFIPEIRSYWTLPSNRPVVQRPEAPARPQLVR